MIGSNMTRRAKILAALAAVLVVVAAVVFAMRFFMAPPADLDLARSKATANGLYTIVIEPEVEPLQQGPLHAWIVTVKTADGQPVMNARLGVDGGMPQHGHGLPTRPEASDIGDGRYRVEGVRFNMGGWWVFKLAVEGPAGRDEAEFNLVL
jgi:hypothetical protein